MKTSEIPVEIRSALFNARVRLGARRTIVWANGYVSGTSHPMTPEGNLLYYYLSPETGVSPVEVVERFTAICRYVSNLRPFRSPEAEVRRKVKYNTSKRYAVLLRCGELAAEDGVRGCVTTWPTREAAECGRIWPKSDFSRPVIAGDTIVRLKRIPANPSDLDAIAERYPVTA